MFRVAASRWRLSSATAERRISTTTVWGVAGASIVLAVVAALLAVWLLYQNWDRHLRTNAVNASTLAAEQAQAIFTTARFHVQAAKRELLLRHGARYWLDRPDRLQEILTDISRVNPERGIFDLVAIDLSGRVLALSDRPEARGVSLANRRYFQALVAGGAERALGDPEVGPAGGEPVVRYVEWVKDGAGRPVFALGAAVELRVLNRLHAGIADGVPAASALVRSDDGTPLVGTWPSDAVPPLGEESRDWIVARAPVPGWPVVAVAGTPKSLIWREITLPSAMVLATVLLLSAGIVLVVQIWQQRQRSYAALQRVEERQRVLLDELNHRVKNILATVQSIAVRTLRSSSSLEEFERAFEGRLEALARASTLLAVTRWEAAGLRAVVEGALAPYRGGDGTVALSGPEVTLPSKAALTLSLVLHELATNAAKHGALSVPRGRVEVSWRIEGAGADRRLSFAWTERGGPEVRQPERCGFGRALIERSVAHELDGTARLEFTPAGLRCRIELPLAGDA